jgi:hypothetical protein
VRKFTEQCIEPSTRRKYESTLRLYAEIMRNAGLQYRPLTTQRTILFIYCLVKGSYKATTIETYVSTVKSQLLLKGDPPLTASDERLVKSAMRAAQKIANTDVKRAATITPLELGELCRAEPNDEILTGMLLSFYALLRSAEVVQLRCKDITDSTSTGDVQSFLVVNVAKSKTDIYSRGAKVAVGCVCSDHRVRNAPQYFRVSVPPSQKSFDSEANLWCR